MAAVAADEALMFPKGAGRSLWKFFARRSLGIEPGPFKPWGIALASPFPRGSRSVDISMRNTQSPD